jgi:rod shape-determining protein MreB
MASDVALDIGTSFTRLATEERGVVFNEPTIVAIDTSTGEVVDIGYGALHAVGTSPRHVVAFRPFAKGATVDFDVTARLISAVFLRAGYSRMSRLRVVMSVPTLATAIERRALRQAAVQAGASDVSLIETPMVAAIGLGMPIEEPVGSAIAVLGAGSSEIALIALGGIVTGGSLRVGGNDLDASIGTMIRQLYGVVVSPTLLEELKIGLGSALGRTDREVRVVPARTVNHGKPVSVEVPAKQINTSIVDVINASIRMMQECLGESPPDLAQDVLTHGLTLAGGHARLTDLAEIIAKETGVEVRVAPTPELVVINGLQKCLGEMRSLHKLFREADR